MNQEETESIQQLVARGTPLRDVAAAAVRLRFGDDVASLARLKVQWAQLGSTVRLAPTTRLFFEPFRADEASVAVTLPWCSNLGHECGVVARVTFDEDDGRSLAWLRVVYPGYGLVWAHQSGVAAWQPADDSRGGACVLSSLAFSFHGQRDLPQELAAETFRISAMLPLLTCATLMTLSMERAEISRDDLAHMLAVCPRLETLVLDRCVVECLDPLVDAYRQKRARVAVLSLRGTFDLRLHAMLVDRQPMLVSSLHGYRRDGDAPAWISPLVGVASSSLSLRRLHVTCRHELQGTCAALLSPLRGAVLADPPRLQRALLSVLRVFAYGLPEIARLVLALAEGGVVRTITWDSLVHS